MDIQKIAIVGGGTAGWLAANHLGKVLQHRPGVSITLIESPDIPTIGVGEGTVPAIRRSLQSFGISETDFIRQCDVTFKQSIKFCNWLDKARHGEDNFYHHLFDKPSPLGEDLTPWWLANESRAYADFVSPQFAVCEALRAPKTIATPEYQGSVGYAYHLNAAKFALLLADNAVTKFKVEHLKANVIEVLHHDNGAIKALVTDQHGVLDFDFYIDCSGFQSLLIDKALSVPFVDKSHQLFVDKALTVQVPTAPDEAIPPFTIATAHQAGWIWDIALTNRRGVGFVFSQSHLEQSKAEDKLDLYLNGQLANYSYRSLPMKVGYREKFWHKNCVALGLAQGFLEPLEATSILLTDFAASYLADRFPSSIDDMAHLEKRFNHTMVYAWERVVEFIKMHYCLSDRVDSAFWLDNRLEDTIPPALLERLELWEQFPPIKEDFFTKFEVFDVDNFLYVLYGMNFSTRQQSIDAFTGRMSIEQSDRVRQIGHRMVAELPAHRDLLEKIYRFGLQKI